MIADVSRVRLALDQILTSIGSPGSVFELWEGQVPATATSATTGGSPPRVLLASITVGATSPAFPSSSGTPPESSMTGGPPVAGPTAAVAAGTASWFRLKDSSGNPVLQGSVGSPSGSEINLNTTTVVVGANCSITAFKVKLTGLDA